MKTLYFILVIIFLSSRTLANGVMVVDAGSGKYLSMTSSDVRVSVENQVALTTTRQVFINNDSTCYAVYSFPLPAGASAIQLRWEINGLWQEAIISPTPQDSSLPNSGGSIKKDLEVYLGATPLFFPIKDSIQVESTITVELTYVQLLPYELGIVSYAYPNDYRKIQIGGVDSQSFHFELHSARLIDALSLTNPMIGQTVNNDGHFAYIDYSTADSTASTGYTVTYSLSTTDLGLFGFSSFLDSVCDGTGRGFLLFVAEPDGSEQTESIDKVFTLIIDKSGSMSGTKIEQARNAAKFIIENLNDGDKFNMVVFDNSVSSFKPAHVEYNGVARSEALSYISSLRDGGSTNISGAFSTALSQFPSADSNIASIIIFLTDGQPTAGITGRDALVSHVNSLNIDKKAIIFPFGIGNDVDRTLLTRIADDNNGIADFLANDELQAKISKFYLKIRNPVLLNSWVSFEPPVINEVYPTRFPNLYKGQQLFVTGRYSESAHPLTITLGGTAFGKQVQYQYQIDLADTLIPKYQFLPKVWAKMKIEELLVKYNTLSSSSHQADSLKQLVTEISLCFGVITPFTSFSIKVDDNGGGASSVNEDPSDENTQHITASPNPFGSSVLLSFSLDKSIVGEYEIHIYDMSGKLARKLTLYLDGRERYELLWDGKDMNGQVLPSGTYICVLQTDSEFITGKVIKQ